MGRALWRNPLRGAGSHGMGCGAYPSRTSGQRCRSSRGCWHPRSRQHQRCSFAWRSHRGVGRLACRHRGQHWRCSPRAAACFGPRVRHTKPSDRACGARRRRRGHALSHHRRLGVVRATAHRGGSGQFCGSNHVRSLPRLARHAHCRAPTPTRTFTAIGNSNRTLTRMEVRFCWLGQRRRRSAHAAVTTR
ncbi:unannotated protein [freshwater metagenome]|uniref:Unannotated protein n=1 Tax=freshwater metagenome TaxID=449393 RepID=A0A6J6NJY7_9ZZZZ